MDIISEIKKKPVITLMCVIIGISLYMYLYSPVFPNTSKVKHHINEANIETFKINTKSPSSQLNLTAAESQSLKISRKEEVLWTGDQAQQKQLLQWLESRGWYDTGNSRDDYKTYSRETLEQFANNGDLHALTLLVKGSGGVERKSLQIRAAIYGSTFALLGLIDTVLPSSLESISNEQRHEKILEAAAYAKVAEMRGELFKTFDEHLKNIEDNFMEGKLTDDDLKIVNEKADQIYTDLEFQRTSLGMGKFDNSFPPTIKAYYKSLGLLKE